MVGWGRDVREQQPAVFTDCFVPRLCWWRCCCWRETGGNSDYYSRNSRNKKTEDFYATVDRGGEGGRRWKVIDTESRRSLGSQEAAACSPFSVSYCGEQSCSVFLNLKTRPIMHKGLVCTATVCCLATGEYHNIFNKKLSVNNQIFCFGIRSRGVSSLGEQYK